MSLPIRSPHCSQPLPSIQPPTHTLLIEISTCTHSMTSPPPSHPATSTAIQQLSALPSQPCSPTQPPHCESPQPPACSSPPHHPHSISQCLLIVEQMEFCRCLPVCVKQHPFRSLTGVLCCFRPAKRGSELCLALAQKV